MDSVLVGSKGINDVGMSKNTKTDELIERVRQNYKKSAMEICDDIFQREADRSDSLYKLHRAEKLADEDKTRTSHYDLQE